MKLKVILSTVIVCIAMVGCKKAPAAQSAAAAATPPAAAGQGTGTAPGAPVPPAPPKPVPAEIPAVVARVNGQDLTKADFERMIKTIEAQNNNQQIPPDRRDEILRKLLDQLVVYTLLNQEAKSRGLVATDAEIDAKLAEVRKQFPTPDAFEKALKDRGMTVDSFRADARADLSANKVVDAEVGGIAGPSDAEAKAYYAKNSDKFNQPECVQASHILIRVDEKADAAAKAKAKSTIESVLKKAKAGEDFGKLAQQYSQDGSASQGGDLGCFPRGQMVPPFSDAAFALKPGEISNVVTTQFGYHIIKVVDHKTGGVTPYEQLSPENVGQLKQMIESEKKQQHMDAFINGLKQKAKIEILI